MIYLMQKEGEEQTIEQSKEEALEHISKIEHNSICELMAFHNPHPTMLLVSKACIRILAGVYHRIKVNHKNDPVKSDWDQAKIMYLMNPHEFLDICNKVTSMVGSNQTLDRHIDEVREEFMGEGSFEPSHIMKYSLAMGNMSAWIHSLVRYKQALYTQRELEVNQ